MDMAYDVFLKQTINEPKHNDKFSRKAWEVVITQPCDKNNLNA